MTVSQHAASHMLNILYYIFLKLYIYINFFSLRIKFQVLISCVAMKQTAYLTANFNI